MVRYSKGAKILSEGEEGQDIFLIDSGEVEIRRQTPFGHYPFARLKAGDVFGETSFIDGQPRSGDAFVVEDAVIFPLNALALAPVVEEHPRWALALYWALWKSLSRKLRLTNETLADFFSGARKKRRSSRCPARTKTSGSGSTRSATSSASSRCRRWRSTSSPASPRRSTSSARNTLFREGQEGDALYIVLEGQIRISKDTAAGEEALAILERGDYFGEMALIDRQPRSADAKAHSEEVVVLTISREVLEGILSVQKVSSLRLSKLLCRLIAKRLARDRPQAGLLVHLRPGLGRNPGRAQHLLAPAAQRLGVHRGEAEPGPFGGIGPALLAQRAVRAARPPGRPPP